MASKSNPKTEENMNNVRR